MSFTINQSMSVFIPRVFSNITSERIIHVFKNNLIGIIEYVDLVAKMDNNGVMYNSAYIHFQSWFDNSITQNIQEKIMNGKVTRVIYDDPWHWILLENKAITKKVGNERRKIRINLLSHLEEEKEKEKDFIEPYLLTEEDNIKIMEYEKLLNCEIKKLNEMRIKLKNISEEEYMNNYPIYVV